MWIAPAHAFAQSGLLWRPEDRVLLSDFSRVTSLARDNAALYAATANGLLIYDLTTRRFRLPLTVEDGYPVAERPTAVAYAQSDFQLVIGTSAGSIYTVAPRIQHFDDVARLPGAITRILAPRTGFDIYAQTTAGWYRLRSGSFFPEQAAPPAAPAIGAGDPYLRSMLGSAGSIPGRGTAPLTALETDVANNGYFAATLGNGIFQLDTRSLERTRLQYGLNTRGAGAIALWRGRLWFGGDERTFSGPLVSATPELSDFRDYSPGSGAPQDIITALLATDSALWVGTVSGLYALRGRPGAERWLNYAQAAPGRISSLAEAADGGVFAGSERGLTQVSAGGTSDVILTGHAVFGLGPGRDTLWIASDAGVAVFPLAGAQPAAALRGGGTPDLQVFDVKAVGDTVYAVTGEGLYRRGPSGWSGPDRSLAGPLGPLGRIRTGDGAVWILGTLGVAVRRAQSGTWSYYVATDDIPEAPVRDLLPLGDTWWLATPAGALRITHRR